ncbi:hypothetical protein Pyn_25712 [Prunus yedoensis var. nudiflora]|uniref:Uncharacterized protein n=1 Tax=Prunus yedoensis var. nudiflora TaxID=2094558 RepID=A0A314XUI4_PRUYE|nr:hypothetical protein Pyn_25712 [Prunus yedoensis var. nudiflora]
MAAPSKQKIGGLLGFSDANRPLMLCKSPTERVQMKATRDSYLNLRRRASSMQDRANLLSDLMLCNITNSLHVCIALSIVRWVSLTVCGRVGAHLLKTFVAFSIGSVRPARRKYHTLAD